MKDIIKAILSLIFVALLAIGVFYTGEEKTSTSKKDFIPEGRIDIHIPLEKNNILKVEFNNSVQNKKDWSKNKEWYAIQTKDKNIAIKVTPSKEKDIDIDLRGPHEKGQDGKLIEHWVKFNSLKIDGKEILKTPQEVWHDKPFTHKFTGKKNKTHTIEATWEPK